MNTKKARPFPLSQISTGLVQLPIMSRAGAGMATQKAPACCDYSETKDAATLLKVFW